MRDITFETARTLNLGCGENLIDGVWNVDLYATKADEHHDILLPKAEWNGHFERVLLFHTVEHIEKPKWPTLFGNIWNWLEMGGHLLVTYPEFDKIATNWITNFRGQRDFWEATIYGRQLHDGDYHVSLMSTPLLTSFLAQVGFEFVKSCPEGDGQEFNTVLYVRKVKRPLTYEEVIQKEIFA